MLIFSIFSAIDYFQAEKVNNKQKQKTIRTIRNIEVTSSVQRSSHISSWEIDEQRVHSVPRALLAAVVKLEQTNNSVTWYYHKSISKEAVMKAPFAILLFQALCVLCCLLSWHVF